MALLALSSRVRVSGLVPSTTFGGCSKAMAAWLDKGQPAAMEIASRRAGLAPGKRRMGAPAPASGLDVLGGIEICAPHSPEEVMHALRDIATR
ncbi:hypothetical protein [Cupriavidus basilensis]